MKKTQTHKIVWFCLLNGVGWVWCSYLLAFFEKVEIAEYLSGLAITEIIAVVLLYCLKSLFEKTEKFGSVGSKKKRTTTLKKEPKKPKALQTSETVPEDLAGNEEVGDQLTV